MTDQNVPTPGRVLVVGSANVDLTAEVAALPRPGQTVLAHGFSRRTGGKGSNQAVAAARLDAAVSLVAAVGDDDGGTAVRTGLIAAGVRTDRLQVLTGATTGTAVITVDDAGENSIVVAPGANHRLSIAQVEAGVADSGAGDVVVVSLEIEPAVAGAALRRARSRGATTVLNPSPFSPAVAELLADVDVVILNEGEAAELGTTFLDGFAGAVVITLGGAGARVRPAASTARSPLVRDWESLAAPRVEVVDTTGCGDAFAGALACELAAGTGLVEATGTAVRYAALAATSAGAQTSYVDRAAFEEHRRSEAPPLSAG